MIPTLTIFVFLALPLSTTQGMLKWTVAPSYVDDKPLFFLHFSVLVWPFYSTISCFILARVELAFCGLYCSYKWYFLCFRCLYQKVRNLLVLIERKVVGAKFEEEDVRTCYRMWTVVLWCQELCTEWLTAVCLDHVYFLRTHDFLCDGAQPCILLNYQFLSVFRSLIAGCDVLF